MLNLDPTRPATAPRDAATVLLVRDGGEGLEIFCVKRSDKSGFMASAVVFPGGKVDADDESEEWRALVTEPRVPRLESFTGGRPLAFAVAACREALEEAAILPVAAGSVTHDEVVALRGSMSREETSLRAYLAARGLRLDVAALHPFARWVTPIAESRRFDARFFLARAPREQTGAHDAHETTESFWGTPRKVLADFEAGVLQLAPPTHRCLAILAAASNVDDALRIADGACLDPICPVLTPHGEGASATMALALPGDPAHEVRETRVPGPTRFVLRDGRFVPES